MVTSEEIKRRLKAKRKGIKSPSQKKQKSPMSETSNKEIERRLEKVRSGVKPLSAEKESKLEENFCPKCKTKNTSEAKFCVSCGEMLKEKGHTTPAEIETESSETSITTLSKAPWSSKKEYKVCPACKQKNKLEAKFCVICGNKFKEEASPEELLNLSQSTNENVKEYSSNTIQEENKLTEKSLEIAEDNQENTEIITTKKKELMISSDTKESDSPTKSESESSALVMNDEKGEIVTSSDPKANQEISESLSESIDPVEKIRKAKELLDMGAITQKEFEQIKNKYLKQI